MRSRISVFAFLLVAGSFTLPLVAHAGIPFFGPIIDKSWTVSSTGIQCALGWGAVIMVINNIISLLITLAIVFVAPLMIAWSGFLYVVNPVDPSGISKAKGILLHTVVGIVIALCGWLIVDAIMVALYNPDTPISGGKLGAWSSLITSGNALTCLPQQGVGTGLNQSANGAPGVTVGTGVLSTGLSNSPGNPCNPATIAAAVPGVSASQANLLACIAKGESSCGATNPPYNLNFSWDKATPNGKASTAAGAYQVVLSSNSRCYDNSVCEQAGGTPGTKLNCASGFGPGGFTTGGNPTVLAKCKQAAGNVACSAAAAVCNLNQQSFAAAYGTDPYMASCQSQYGGQLIF